MGKVKLATRKSPRSVAAWLSTVLLAVAVVASGCHVPPQPPAGRTDLERQGRHVLQLAGGCGCHGTNFAGWKAGSPDSLPRALPYGERFVGTYGVVPAANITQDLSGIGRWTDDQIAQAVTDGVDPSGQQLSPAMPYRAYHGMAKSDVRALVAYLRTLPPVRNDVPAPSLQGPLPEMGSLPPAPDTRPTEDIALGRYIVRNVSFCADCHATRIAGFREKPLLGGTITIDGKQVNVPNITPDREGGIGTWSEEEIARYLRTGTRPDGGLAQSAMAGLILTSYSHFTPTEARAVAAYLKSQIPVSMGRSRDKR